MDFEYDRSGEGIEPTQSDDTSVGTVLVDADDRLRFVFENPLSDLPEVARGLLLAAKHIVATKGFDSLSLNSIAEESGENKAMIAYYFGSKAGLIAAVLDSVIHDEYLASVARMKDVVPGQRSGRLVEEIRLMTGATEEFRVFFELLPVALRNNMLRARISRLYEWYSKEKLAWLGVDDDAGALDDPDIQGLSQLLSALIDGIALRVAIDPDLDLTAAYDVLSRMIESCFGSVLGIEERSASEEQAPPRVSAGC